MGNENQLALKRLILGMAQEKTSGGRLDLRKVQLQPHPQGLYLHVTCWHWMEKRQMDWCLAVSL